MKLEEQIGRTIVIAPLIHVTTCTIYLFGLSSGFGSTLYTLLTVSDFFQVTIGGMISMYGMAIVVPSIIAVYWHGRKAILSATKEAKSVRAQLRLDELTVKSIVFLALGRVLYDIFTYDTGIETSFALTLLAMACATSVGLFVFATQLFGFDRARTLIAIGVIIFGATVFGEGFDGGEFMRRGPYEHFKARGMRCDEHAVLFAAGGRFVTVTPDGRRNVVDDECKIQFRFPDAPPLSQITLIDYLRGRFATLRDRIAARPSQTMRKEASERRPAPAKDSKVVGD